MSSTTITKWLLRAGAAVVLTGCVLGVSCMYWMYGTVRDVSSKARQKYGGGTVAALIRVVESGTSSVREKNDAVWALGQIADKRALPVLHRVYTGVIPDREPLDTVLSQYELRKAIRWCEHGNRTSWMYTGIARDGE